MAADVERKEHRSNNDTCTLSILMYSIFLNELKGKKSYFLQIFGVFQMVSVQGRYLPVTSVVVLISTSTFYTSGGT